MEDEENNINQKKRSEFSLEGGKKPFSLYTRRVINPNGIVNYLKETSSKGLCGIMNLGNNCYMNSGITCLINVIELTYYFLKGDYKNDLNPNDSSIPEIWYDLIIKSWVEKTDIIDPSDFKEILSRKNPQFDGYNQQDASELINSILNLLNEGLKAEVKNEQNNNNQLYEKSPKTFWKDNLRLNDSIITDLFTGQLVTITHCPECNNKKEVYDIFNILNIPFPKFDINYINNFQFFYVPKYGIRRPVRILYKKFRKDATFDECFSKLRKDIKFIYHNKIGDELIINEIYNRRSKNMIKDRITIQDSIKSKTFYFCYDIVNKEDKKYIPIYLSIEGGKLSDYPRIIFISENETLDDLRFKIYLLIRKYFYSPLSDEEEEIKIDELTKKIIKYIKNKTIDDLPIMNSIYDEYNTCFKSAPLNDNVRAFINNMPFKIYLINKNDENDKIIFTPNFIELSNEFKNKCNVNNFNDSIISIIELEKNYYINIEFDIQSNYINTYYGRFSLNICTSFNATYNEEEDKKLTLESCFKYYIKEENLNIDNEWTCLQCNKKVKAKKNIELYYLPKIFIICLNRFIKNDENWEKNEKEVEFKIENMDMKDYMIGPDKNNSQYDLFAVIQHHGTIENGHYISIIKNSGQWYEFNDSRVNQTDINNEDKSHAYILFYRRKTD